MYGSKAAWHCRTTFAFFSGVDAAAATVVCALGAATRRAARTRRTAADRITAPGYVLRASSETVNPCQSVMPLCVGLSVRTSEAPGARGFRYMGAAGFEP